MPLETVIFERISDTFTIPTASAVQAAIAKDPQARPACRVAVLEFHRRLAQSKHLRSWLRYSDTRAKLAAEGFNLTDEEAAPFENSTATDAAKDAAEQILFFQFRSRLESEIKVISDRAVKSAIAELQRDLGELASGDSLHAKYGAPPSPLKAALQSAIANLESDLARPFSLAWHYDPRVAISQMLFPESSPLEIEEKPVPPAPSFVPNAGNLKTAASIATARAA